MFVDAKIYTEFFRKKPDSGKFFPYLLIVVCIFASGIGCCRNEIDLTECTWIECIVDR